MEWTFKTLKFGTDRTAEWAVAGFRFANLVSAVQGVAAYMYDHAERGNMVVVALEPAREYKAVADRMAEHELMLGYLKTEYANSERGGNRMQWEMIHQIDPEWPDPWRARSVDSGHDPSLEIFCQFVDGCKNHEACRAAGKCLDDAMMGR